MKNPKFKKGDVVKVLDHPGLSVLAFQKGTVEELHRSFRQYLIHPLGPGLWSWWIKEKDLELILSEDSE